MRKDEFFHHRPHQIVFSHVSWRERKTLLDTYNLPAAIMLDALSWPHTNPEKRPDITLGGEQFSQSVTCEPIQYVPMDFLLLKTSMCNFCHLVRNFFPSQATDRPCLTALPTAVWLKTVVEFSLRFLPFLLLSSLSPHAICSRQAPLQAAAKVHFTRRRGLFSWLTKRS